MSAAGGTRPAANELFLDSEDEGLAQTVINRQTQESLQHRQTQADRPLRPHRFSPTNISSDCDVRLSDKLTNSWRVCARNEGKSWAEIVLFMLPIRVERGRFQKAGSAFQLEESEERRGGDRRRGVRRRERDSFSLPWGHRSTIPPTVVTESFIYLRRPSVQSV